MITCRDCLEFLMAYLDGELPADQRARFEEHLRACPPCVDYMDSYRRAVALAHEACKDHPDSIPKLPEKLVHAIVSSMRGTGSPGGGGTPGGCGPGPTCP